MKLKKNDIMLVVACKEESNGLLEKLGVDIIYTGVGKVNASYHLTKALYERKMNGKMPKYIINVGSCGSKKFKKGSLVSCNGFIQRDMDCRAFGYKLGETPSDSFPLIIETKQILKDLNSAICGSGDSFQTTESKIKEIDVVDMEAYALARICNLEKIDFISIKYITDGLDNNGADDWNSEVLSSAESFYNYLLNIIE